MSSSDEDDAYGPPLPPGFKSNTAKERKRDCGPALTLSTKSSDKERALKATADGDSDGDSSDGESYTPALPPHLQKSGEKKEDLSDSDDAYMPPLPPNLQRGELKRRVCERDVQKSKYVKRSSEDEDFDDDDMYGPALPPHLMKSKNNQSSLPRGERILGPSLPAGFVPSASLSSFKTTKEEDEEEDSSDEEETDSPAVGPMPSTVAFNEEEYRIQQFELRAKRMRDKLEGKLDDSKPVKRETWMLELPEDKPNFCGLAPRQFLKKAPQEKGDRSVWTDTPADKERKEKMESNEEESIENPVDTVSQKRDEDLTARVEKYNKEKRDKPLIDLHKKKLKEKGMASGPKERRPFSREEDMNVNKFDDAQKDTILKKARQLNDRFSSGNRKFL